MGAFRVRTFGDGRVDARRPDISRTTDVVDTMPEQDRLRELSNRRDYFPGDLLPAASTANDIFAQHIPRKT
jgi:hypothetical protein